MECGWLFFDATENKSRRWRQVRVCGKRAKVRAVPGAKGSRRYGQGINGLAGG